MRVPTGNRRTQALHVFKLTLTETVTTILIIVHSHHRRQGQIKAPDCWFHEEGHVLEGKGDEVDIIDDEEVADGD